MKKFRVVALEERIVLDAEIGNALEHHPQQEPPVVSQQPSQEPEHSSCENHLNKNPYVDEKHIVQDGAKVLLTSMEELTKHDSPWLQEGMQKDCVVVPYLKSDDFEHLANRIREALFDQHQALANRIVVAHPEDFRDDTQFWDGLKELIFDHGVIEVDGPFPVDSSGLIPLENSDISHYFGDVPQLRNLFVPISSQIESQVAFDSQFFHQDFQEDSMKQPISSDFVENSDSSFPIDVMMSDNMELFPINSVNFFEKECFFGVHNEHALNPFLGNVMAFHNADKPLDIEYAIISGNEKGDFHIDPSTGDLFALPSFLPDDQEHSLIVKASNDEGFDIANVTVFPQSLNDQFLSDTRPFPFDQGEMMSLGDVFKVTDFGKILLGCEKPIVPYIDFPPPYEEPSFNFQQDNYHFIVNQEDRSSFFSDFGRVLLDPSSDKPGNNINYSIVSGDDLGIFSISGDDKGAYLRLNPEANIVQEGSYHLTLLADNGFQQKSTDIFVDVEGDYLSPKQVLDVFQDEYFEYPLRNIFPHQPDNHCYIYQAVGLPEGLALDQDSMSIRGIIPCSESPQICSDVFISSTDMSGITEVESVRMFLMPPTNGQDVDFAIKAPQSFEVYPNEVVHIPDIYLKSPFDQVKMSLKSDRGEIYCLDLPEGVKEIALEQDQNFHRVFEGSVDQMRYILDRLEYKAPQNFAEGMPTLSIEMTSLDDVSRTQIDIGFIENSHDINVLDEDSEHLIKYYAYGSMEEVQRGGNLESHIDDYNVVSKDRYEPFSFKVLDIAQISDDHTALTFNSDLSHARSIFDYMKSFSLGNSFSSHSFDSLFSATWLNQGQFENYTLSFQEAIRLSQEAFNAVNGIESPLSLK